MKSFLVFTVGALSFIYLLNPTAGVFEIIPDLVPIFGNIDEATATALLISSLGYFGINVSDFFSRDRDKDTTTK